MNKPNVPVFLITFAIDTIPCWDKSHTKFITTPNKINIKNIHIKLKFATEYICKAPLNVFWLVWLNIYPVIHPKIIPTNTLMSITWIPKILAYPVPIKPIISLHCANWSSEVDIVLEAIRYIK